jgi:hypothetical protein
MPRPLSNDGFDSINAYVLGAACKGYLNTTTSERVRIEPKVAPEFAHQMARGFGAPEHNEAGASEDMADLHHRREGTRCAMASGSFER